MSVHVLLCLCTFLALTFDVTLCSDGKYNACEIDGTNVKNNQINEDGVTNNVDDNEIDEDGVTNMHGSQINENGGVTNTHGSQINENGGVTNTHGSRNDGDDVTLTDEEKNQKRIATEMELGQFDDELLNSECMKQECCLADFLLDEYYDYSVELQGVKRADQIIVMLNGGALRNSIPTGKITREQLAERLPAKVSMGRISLSGSDVKKAIEHAVYNYDGKKGHDEFLQVSGLRITIDPSKPPGQRLDSVKIKGTNEELKDDDEYIVVISKNMSDTMLDKYGLDPTLRFTEFYFSLLDVVSESISRLKNVTKKTDGRITFLASKQSQSCSPKS